MICSALRAILPLFARGATVVDMRQDTGSEAD